MTESFELTVRGPFALAAAARFQESFPAGQGGGGPACLDLAFPADGDWATVGVRVTARGDRPVGTVVANPGGLPVAEIRAQVERILSLDVDGSGFAAVGIGPFSAELTLIRGAGHPDAFPVHTPRLHRAMAQLYDLGPEPPLPVLEAIAEGWRPYRSWVAFLVRNAG